MTSQAEDLYDWPGRRGDKWLEHVEAMERMLAPFDLPLVEALALSTSAKMVDVGCGGGATARAVLRSAPRGSAVLGLDLHEGLIDVARRRCTGQHAEFRVADVEKTEGLGGRFDRVYSRFGVMFFETPGRAFERLRCWLVPGGAAVFTVWGPLSENPWVSLVRDAVAAEVELPAPRPTAPGPFRYAAAGELGALLRSVGFVEVQEREHRCSVAVGQSGAGDAARFALSGFSTFAERLRVAGPAAAARARDRLADSFAAYERANGRVELPATVWVIRGATAS
jgi:SAM-dependent methyltransferase